MINCGSCSYFVEHSNRVFLRLIERFGFVFDQCVEIDGGRACVATYRSKQCQIAFTLLDGSFNCSIANLEAPFPAQGLQDVGEFGWYHVVSLVEFKVGEKLLDRQIMNDFLDGRRDYFVWQAQILYDNAEAIFAMFSPGMSQTWHGDLIRFIKN